MATGQGELGVPLMSRRTVSRNRATGAPAAQRRSAAAVRYSVFRATTRSSTTIGRGFTVPNPTVSGHGHVGKMMFRCSNPIYFPSPSEQVKALMVAKRLQGQSGFLSGLKSLAKRLPWLRHDSNRDRRTLMPRKV